MIDNVLYTVTLHLLILGGIVWGLLGLTEYNVLSRAFRQLGIHQGSRVVYIMIGLATLIFLLKFYHKNMNQPRMAQTVFPPHLINVGYPLDYDREITVSAPDSAKYAIYWTALGKEEVNDGSSYDKAYGDFSNSGAVEVENGVARLRFRDPASYGHHRPHIHYRWIQKNGKMSPLQTMNV